jgi:hypothetical protein
MWLSNLLSHLVILLQCLPAGVDLILQTVLRLYDGIYEAGDAHIRLLAPTGLSKQLVGYFSVELSP